MDKNNNKKSGFDAPAYGTMQPKGTKVKQKANGRIELIPPKKKGTK